MEQNRNFDPRCDLSQIAVVIPALNPGPILLDIVQKLLNVGFGQLIVVDDGSNAQCAAVFSSLHGLSGVLLLRHAVNCGKGRALKTAFNHFLVNYPEMIGAVTADADGQHSTEDITRVGIQLTRPEIQEQGAVILGVRNFGDNVPWRSKVGNTLTGIVFRFLFGRTISDTQTGLRAFPRAVLKHLLTVSGERYEYESGILISAILQRLPLVEIPITTIYIDGNRCSHFNPLIDSMRIYFVLFRFFASSLLTSAIDFVAFTIAFIYSDNMLTSMITGRGLALLANYSINKRLVFRHKSGGIVVFFRYLALVVLLGAISYLMMCEMRYQLGLNTLLVKVIAESILFLLSFSVQREVIFFDHRLEKENRN